MQADELKQIFREGWMNSSVVEHRVERFIEGEFGFEPSFQAWQSVLKQAIGDQEVASAVDMGTGPGTIAQFWAAMGIETTGVAFSTTMLAAAREVAAKRGLKINFMEGDAEQPPLQEGTFDLLSSRAVLFTLPHPGYAVARWMRLLKPGGLMVLIGEIPPADPDKQKRAFRPAQGWKPDDTYREAMSQLPFREHTDQMLRVVMEAAGLIEIKNLQMDNVIAAREAHDRLDPEYGVLQGTPYILTGRRPD